MILKIRIITNAKTTQIVDRVGSLLRMEVTASEYGKKTNEIIRKYLADFFNVKKDKVLVRRGQEGKEKIIEIVSSSDDELKEILESIP